MGEACRLAAVSTVEDRDPLAVAISIWGASRRSISRRALIGRPVLTQALPAAAPVSPLYGEGDRTAEGTLDVLPDAGHWAMYEAAEAFNDRLRDRLERSGGK